MAAPECMVEGCGASALTIDDLTPDREWASLPGEVIVCNHHRDELAKPETEWVLIRDDRKVYVGDQLRKLDEYILLEAPRELIGTGSNREFSDEARDDGWYLPLKVRKRGDQREQTLTIVIPADELLRELAALIQDI
ncbi:hypothetical protein [Mycolicibacterium pallens]|uniref:Uncharacterized protein n=1 Tax=Mycolicibacterium pallens TaxID=370524 RepID=A0ABX8VLN0_9MYCO|nr:hypothetical protein [Mycolicibacterium pallens]QYL18684.1 hypothetical protein K0O64_09415 [Mycolicibacterium pallens]